MKYEVCKDCGIKRNIQDAKDCPVCKYKQERPDFVESRKRRRQISLKEYNHIVKLRKTNTLREVGIIVGKTHETVRKISMGYYPVSKEL